MIEAPSNAPPDTPTSTPRASLLDEHEHRRYADALRRLSMRPLSIARLSRLAGLENHIPAVRAVLRADPRYEKITSSGPERYNLRPQYRHAATLQHARNAAIAPPSTPTKRPRSRPAPTEAS